MARAGAKPRDEEGVIRISSGEFRGRRIDCPQTGGVRPMLNRTRMALFNVLQQKLKGAIVWDCFAGSGLLGIEAISRGAGHCVFIEKQGFHARVVRKNIESLDLQSRSTLIRGSVFDLARPGSPRLPHTPADILLLDPPHAMIRELDGPFWQWMRALHQSPLAGPATLACVGHPAELKFPGELGGWKVQQTRVYGTVAFTIFCEQQPRAQASGLA